MKRWAVVAAIGMTALGQTAAQGLAKTPGVVPGARAVFSLTTTMNVWDVAVKDINGDEWDDVLALCCDEASSPPEKLLAVFLSKAGEIKGAEPIILPLDPATGCVFFAETDGTPPVEAVAAHAEGAAVYRFSGGGFAQAGQHSFFSLFPSNVREPAFIENTAMDLDGDGIDEWLLPMPTGYVLRGPSGPIASVACDVDSAIRAEGSLSVSSRFPSVASFAMEGTRHKGLVFLSDGYADFAFGESWQERQRFEIPEWLGEKWEAGAALHDFDNNGIPDLLITQTSGTINLESVSQIYLARAPMTYPDAPDGRFQCTGSFAAPVVHDVDGDGNKDVVLITIPWGVKFFVNLFVFRSLGVNLEIYPFRDGGFPAKPAFRASIAIDAPDGREQPAYAFGDFNGDGRIDAAFGSGKEKLKVHIGEPNRFLSSKPWVTVDVPAFGVTDTRDLDKNGADDLIVSHPGMTDRRRIEVVVF